MKKLTLLPILIFIFFSCVQDPPVIEAVETADGLRPIYAETDDWDDIKTTTARSINRLGKIYYKDQMIYVNEYLKGIHIIDNSDPTNPVPIKFIEIIGNKDIAIKGDILYADNMSDLVTLDISNLDDIQVKGRVKNIYPEVGQTHPDTESYIGYFECVDGSKGWVIGWEDAILNQPKCWQ